jgi:transcriptional regulator GlxA family with amidase domain
MTDTMHILPNDNFRHIVLIAFDGAQVLDVTGPAAVFAAANDELPAPAYRLTIAPPRGAVMTSSHVGIATEPLPAIETPVDTLLIAGGSDEGLLALIRDPAVRDWVRRTVPGTRRYGSVCAGAFALAAWGLIGERRVATHWRAVDDLRRAYPGLNVDAQALYVEDGPLWTSAGITTGIDMSLALVERDVGSAVATNVARRLVLYARRPGHQSQFSPLLDASAAGDYADLIDWIGANLAAPLGVETLAARAGQSVRSFHRRFTAATGRTPAAFVEARRLEYARTLLATGAPLKRVAADAGFGSAERLTRAFTRVFGVAPSTWRAIHAGDASRTSVRV